MTLNIEYKNINQNARRDVRVKVIKAPLVDTKILKNIISERARALVL